MFTSTADRLPGASAVPARRSWGRRTSGTDLEEFDVKGRRVNCRKVDEPPETIGLEVFRFPAAATFERTCPRFPKKEGTMTPSSIQNAVLPSTLHGESPAPSQGRSSRFGRILFALALAAIALIAAACSSSPSSNPSSEAGSLISQGLTAESHGQVRQAVNDFNEAVAKNPSSAVPYYDLGVVYQERLNDPSLAQSEYNKATLADSSYKPALFNLAILETSSDPQGAINLYNELLKLNPNDPNVLFNLGLLLIAQNQSLTGHADLKKAISLDPSLASRVPKGITP
jgi:cytochrome c-type biogenesis protein CcmH/NrfG